MGFFSLVRVVYSVAILSIATSVAAFQQPLHSTRQPPSVTPKQQNNPFLQLILSSAVAGAMLLAPFSPALASDTAAQISLNTVPPTSIRIQVQDLPVVGSLISGTYQKVPDGDTKFSKPSIVITSPKDKVKAISSAIKGGHLEFDVKGQLINTHLDVDVAADEAGTAKVVVQSPLIPRLPFKNMASSAAGTATGGKESAWNIVTNLGSGESYYFNAKSGLTQYDRPQF